MKKIAFIFFFLHQFIFINRQCSSSTNPIVSISSTPMLKILHCELKCRNSKQMAGIGYIETKSGVVCKCLFIDASCCSTEAECVLTYCSRNKINPEDCIFLESVKRCYVRNYLVTSVQLISANNSSNMFFDFIISPIGRVKLLSLCKIICVTEIEGEMMCQCDELFMDEFLSLQNSTASVINPSNLLWLCKNICSDFQTLNISCTCQQDATVNKITVIAPKQNNVEAICKTLCGPTGGTQTKNGKVCKCVKIDNDCCRSQEQCDEKYCKIGERAEEAEKERCVFTRTVNTCLSYTFIKIIWKK